MLSQVEAYSPLIHLKPPIVHQTSNNRRFNILLMTVGEPERYFVSGYHRWSWSL